MGRLIELQNKKGVYVSELKAKCIDSIINFASDYPVIKQIVLFGSALEERCTESSDIDLLLVADGVKSKFFRGSWLTKFEERVFDLDESQDYDFLFVGRSTENLKGLFAAEIHSKGVIIYDKK